MFRLKRSENPVRFLFQHHCYNNPLMAYLLGYNPCSQFSQHSLSSYNRGSSYQSLPYLHNPVFSNVFGVSRSIDFGIKGCSFDTSGSYSNGTNRIMVNAKARPRGFASRPRHPMLMDLEQENSLRGDGRNAAPVNGDNGLLNGSSAKSPCFRDHSLSHKLSVAVDIDEVLGNFVSAINNFIADRYSSEHSVSEYHVYEFFKIWNCSRDEADFRVHEFFKTPYFKSGIHPLPGAQLALQKLSRYCNLSVVTSRQNVIKDHTLEWIEKNYPGLFHEIHFGNHFALDGVSRPKSEICRSLNAKVLIDDNPRYAIECAESGIRVLLFDYEDSYPWSKDESVDKHPLVTKVKNWEEVEQQLMLLIVS
ncbi:putative 5'(3')-deoxyribonucleotidase, HAD-like domain-containing protein [Lupinus albus]|uniref:Putative 5'(3')-deoxyribonucleotidase, HAD-like domain-containing protein n=1 Tax=Lupinus albus TaxID=3870 RepID=A0A6A4PJ39_LUPAL|nr:putative 5'(3')-deoxyribonucleotidase, HAD-like domain-containing protein [Lupinus albus]